MASADIAQQIAQLDQGYSPTDIYNKVTTQLGIPDARARVTGLQSQIANTETALKNVDPSVTGRTQNSLVTEAQRQRLVNMESAPIQDTYNTQNKDYSAQQQALDALLGQANTQVGLADSEYKTRRQSLADQLTYAQQQEEIQRQQQQAAAEAAAKVTSGSGSGGSGGGNSGSGASGPTYQKRSDGGFNFQNTKGQAISARLYAQLTGTDFNTLLKTLASQGDKGAVDILKNGGSSKYYKSLTWD